MDIYKRLGSYFFILGALISVFAGVFPVEGSTLSGIMAIIVFLGVFSAILNTDSDPREFIIAASGFLILVLAAYALLGENALVQHLVMFFQVSTLFVGSMLATVTLRAIAEFGSQSDAPDQTDVVDRVERIAYSEADKAWNFTVFLAVCLSFIVVLLELFFALAGLEYYFFILDLIITGIFFIDLVVLYRRAGTFWTFLRTSWLDIIATIPFYQFLRVAKIIRLVRLVELLKLNKTLKYFSQRSGVRHYLHGAEPAATEQRPQATPAVMTAAPAEEPRPAATKTAAKRLAGKILRKRN